MTVDVDKIEEAYTACKVALGRGKDACITALLNACGIPDPGFVAWVVGKVLQLFGVDDKKAAFAMAIIGEYAYRTNSFIRGIQLTNHCSICHCKGHNKQNHPSDMQSFLVRHGLVEVVQDVYETMDAADKAIDWADQIDWSDLF